MRSLCVLKYALCILAVIVMSSHEGRAQRLAVSTDLLQWALVSPNLGFEVAVSQHHALAFSASTCPVKVSDRLSVTHVTVLPEYRYWLRIPSYGHYVGGGILYSSYDVSGSRHVSAGNLLGAFADYGYSFILSRRWNIVPHAGIGVGALMRNDTSVIPLIKIGVNIQMVIR